MTFSGKDRIAKEGVLGGFGTVLNLIKNFTITINNDVVDSFFFNEFALG